jgi:hypothetical protein
MESTFVSGERDFITGCVFRNNEKKPIATFNGIVFDFEFDVT